MSSNKRILFITPGFAKGEADDFTIPALQEYVRGIAAHRPDWEVVVFALQFPFVDQPFDYAGFRVYPFNGQNRRWRKPTMVKRAKATFKELHAAAPFDVIHSFWLHDAALMGQKFAKKYGIQHFCTCMGQDVLKSNRYLSWMDTSGFQQVYVSRFQQGQSIIFEKEKSPIVPWGINQDNFNPSAERDIDVLGAGNLIALKNYSGFLKVIQLVKARMPDLKVVIVGEGTEYQQLEREIEKLGLTGVVRLMDRVSRSEVLHLMARSKVFLHTSQYESFGMVLIEAQSSGCQVVSTPVGVAPEVGSVAATEEELAELVVERLQPKARQDEEKPSQAGDWDILNTIKGYETLYTTGLESKGLPHQHHEIG